MQWNSLKTEGQLDLRSILIQDFSSGTAKSHFIKIKLFTFLSQPYISRFLCCWENYASGLESQVILFNSIQKLFFCPELLLLTRAQISELCCCRHWTNIAVAKPNYLHASSWWMPARSSETTSTRVINVCDISNQCDHNCCQVLMLCLESNKVYPCKARKCWMLVSSNCKR